MAIQSSSRSQPTHRTFLPMVKTELEIFAPSMLIISLLLGVLYIKETVDHDVFYNVSEMALVIVSTSEYVV
jgi:hypothetical protein